MKAMLVAKAGLTDRKEYVLEEGKAYLLGRSREAQVIVKDKLASRSHCKVVAAGADEWTVADLGSSNGTYVNRQRVTTRPLHDGDTIQIGRAALQFRLVSAPAAAAPSGKPEAPEFLPLEPEDTDAPPRPPGSEAPARAAPPPPPPSPPPPPPPAPAQPAAPKPPPEHRPPRRPRHGTKLLSEVPAQPPPPPKAKGEKLDEDIRGLFEFLDKVGGGGQPPPRDDLRLQQEEPAPAPGPGRPAPPPPPKEVEREPLFSLLDEAAERAPEPRKPEPKKPQPPPPPPAEQGGLLAFLRKKKKQP